MILICSENGSEAIELAKQHKPELILKDLKMPVLSRWEATKIIKNQMETKLNPVIAISASSAIVSKDDQTFSDFDDYILKPIKMAELIETMKKYLKYTILSKGKAIKQKIILFNEKLTLAQIDKLPEVISILENEFMPRCKIALQNQMIDQIDSFGKDLILLGEKHSLQQIIDYGSKICSFANNFEIDKLTEIMGMFGELTENFKSQIIKH